MLIISFAWTTTALLERRKTVTRRTWSDDYAQRFIRAYDNGELVRAFNKSPRNGGREMAQLRLTARPYKQALGLMTMEDVRREGGLWGSVAEFVQGFDDGKTDPHQKEVWVVEFEVLL